ncbi:crossover junction endonuclease MUS81 isoform X2 [Canis lupus familiaris]|uniref:crossover junction endonuclease MUS81 isoform X2 n=1 Tax=Canis lupus familiaris TaxID=9615 RepID=UPI000BAA15A2|nr:crossover junction endonuclease MUS81 isoform X2 [Canis lupus familiaris]XP_038309650.1 crossover junction endonuclease MUS81 isoform X2 [Canis lupus familiaris]|eukprot:XP_022261345.1 crossover junction endonuclease MUS81 isoform X2 [Canis lupus familiaris]
MAASVRLGRKRPLPVCPNPLFVRWLTEWRDEAASRGRRTQFVFQKALRSLRRYPLPLRSGKEAKILQHFGDRLCRMLDQRLQQHKASGGDHARSSPSGEKSSTPEGPPARVRDSSVPIPAQPKAGGSGSYWPARHSGARAVLLLLYRERLNPSGRSFLTKEELLQRCAQKAPRVALGSTRPWPALRSLLHRNLVLRTHQPARILGTALQRGGRSLSEMCLLQTRKHSWAGPKEADLRSKSTACRWRYSLTPEGLELAQKLAESEGLSSLDVGFRPEEPPGKEPEVPGAASAELGASEGSVQQLPLELGPGEYRVLLCVDVGEAKGAGHKPKLLLELQRLHVTHVVRKLHVGDFVWVAQETRPRDPARPGELVLDHIVERKRLDDLCSSIIDGRFREQKFRLKRCGLGHRVYLVEEHGSAHHLSLPESTLLQAVTNTQVIDGFFVKRTADIKESAAYLALLTLGLQRLYQGHTLRSRPWGTSGDPESRPGPSPHPLCSLLTFSDFNAGAMKNKAQCVQEVFARQLMQVRGVSGEKAAAIVGQYSTPASLLAAYDACVTPKEQEMLLSTIKCGRLQRNLGPALSRIFSQLYCCYSPLT